MSITLTTATSEATPYEMPQNVTGRLHHHGIWTEGSLCDLLAIYESLGANEQKSATITLSERLLLPTPLSPKRRSVLNLFDGEIALLLPYYHAIRAAAAKTAAKTAPGTADEETG